MPTIRDVAKASGLSVATVSMVINSKPGVSERSRHKVQKAIKELNYRPNRVARALSKNQSRLVGILVPSIDNPFFPQVVKSAEDVFFQRNYSTLIGNTEGDMTKAIGYIRAICEGWAEGLIIALTWEMTQQDTLALLRGAGVPVVGMAGARVIPEFDAVIPDDFQGALDAVAYLISLGHHDIGFIGVQNSHTTELRANGYRAALEQNGIPINSRLISLGRHYNNADGYMIAKVLLQRQPRPTAILCFNDVMALGVLTAVHERNLSIPEDISIMGFDDTTGAFSHPQLSSVALPKAEMGFTAASILMERIGGDVGPPEVIRVTPRLVIRESTGPCPE